MTISEKAAQEFIELSKSDSLRDDLKAVSRNRHNPFARNGKVDVDAYIEFVTEFNEFINHQPKPFTSIIDTEMRL